MCYKSQWFTKRSKLKSDNKPQKLQNQNTGKLDLLKTSILNKSKLTIHGNFGRESEKFEQTAVLRRIFFLFASVSRPC